MDSIVGVMQKVAEQEARKIYTTELGVVTAVFPHAADSDKDNYQCSLKLKNKKQPDGKDFELRKVPITTPHMGMVNIPNIGDLVLVTFVGGNINAPIIIGRLYNDPDQPPPNEKGEFLIQHSLKKGGSLKLDKEGVITLTSKDEKSILTVKDEEMSLANEKSTVTVKGEEMSLTNGKGSVEIKGDNITLKNSQCKIALSGGKINIDNGSCTLSVDAVSGIKLQSSSNIAIEAIGQLVIKGAIVQIN